MDIQGKWNVRYAAKQDEVFPNESGDPDEVGEVILAGGIINGHDPFGAKYEGVYSVKGTKITAKVKVTSDKEVDAFIFDDIPNPFELQLEGDFTSSDYFSATGHVVEKNEHEIILNCSRVKEHSEPTKIKPVMKTTPEKSSLHFGRSNLEVVPPSTFNVQALKGLFAVMNDVSESAAEIEVSTLNRSENQSVIDFEKLKDYVRELCRLRVYITSTDGDMFSSYDDSIFDNPNIPIELKLIVFDSSSDFPIQAKRRPQNWTRLELDLSKPRVLDLNLSPSESTPNGSNLVVEGSDNSWANLSFQKIRNVLKKSYSNRGPLHRRNIFDIYVFLFTAPIAFLILSRVESGFHGFFSKLSPFQYFLIFAYQFLFVANLFRIFFNYTRSVFPYIEFESGRVNKGLTRVAWSIISVALLGGLAWSFFTYVTGYLLPIG